MPQASASSAAVAGSPPPAIAFSRATARSTDCTVGSRSACAGCGRVVPMANTSMRATLHQRLPARLTSGLALGTVAPEFTIQSRCSRYERDWTSGMCSGSLDSAPATLDHRGSWAMPPPSPEEGDRNGEQAPGSVRPTGQPAAVTARAADGRGRASRWPGSLAACGGEQLVSGSSASSGGGGGTPKPGGNFRLGVTGGGSKDIIDGQSDHHQARPGAAGVGLGDAAHLRRAVQADHATGWPRRSPRTSRRSGRSGCATASSSTTARRSPPTTSSTRSSGSWIRRRACSAPPASRRSIPRASRRWTT